MDNAKHYDDAEIALIESRCKSNTHRINELQEHQTALDRLATSVEVLATKQETVEGDVKEIKEDVKGRQGSRGAGGRVYRVAAVGCSPMKKLRKRDKYVIAAVLNLCWYCIAVLVLTAHDKVVPDSLTVAWFAAWTAELAFLAGIKIKGKDE